MNPFGHTVLFSVAVFGVIELPSDIVLANKLTESKNTLISSQFGVAKCRLRERILKEYYNKLMWSLKNLLFIE